MNNEDHLLKLLEEVIASGKLAGSEAFEHQMLEDIKELLHGQKRMLDLMEAMVLNSQFDKDDWDLAERVIKILKVSMRTVYRLRRQGRLTWKKIGGKSYYFIPPIFDMRDEFLK